MSCWEQFGGVLAWEWHDPDLQSVHFLTVASYNFQHPAQFTHEALEKLQEMFIDHLDNGTPVSLLRQRMARNAAGEKKVLRDVAIQQKILRHWHMTIADVYLPDHPQEAADRVRAWASSIRSEL